MKKCVKKLIFSTALVSMAVLSTLSVSALTITESVNANDEFDTLSEGTTVIGITKFEPDVVITALRASKATYNDVTFNFGSEDYEGVEIYYLLLDSWYKIDEDNNASLVEDDELIEKLNELDIYYVNNKEKTIEVDYSIQLDENYELEFETDNNKNNDIKYENGKLMIPATVKKVEVFVKNKETNTRKKLDVFEKNSLNKVEFNNDSSTGTIAKGDSTGGSLTYNVNGNTITIDGEVEWYGADASAQNGRKAGNYASVRIDAGSVYTKEDLLENATVKIDDRELVKWEVVIDESLGEDTYFVFYPRFDSDTRTHTVVIEWEKGNTQTFTIELADDATLEESAQGTIAKGDSTGGELTYDVNGNTITIDGEIEWVGADDNAQNGRIAGNYASVKISANEIYTKEYLVNNATVKIDDRELVKWEVVIDESLGEDTYFVFYPRFDSGTRTHTVVIEWEKGNTQTFTIELSEDATLQEEPSEEVE